MTSVFKYKQLIIEIKLMVDSGLYKRNSYKSALSYCNTNNL